MDDVKQIVILNGGKGTRVKKITKNTPKCLIKFKKKTFLSLQIKKLANEGFNSFLILTGKKNK